MWGSQPTLTMVVVVIGMLFISTLSTPLSGTNIKEVRGKLTVSWPETGLEVCQWLEEGSVQRSCYDCFNTADTWKKVKRCVRDWLPLPIARCSDTASKTKKAFNRCVSKNYEKSVQFDKKANMFYKKSNKFMSMIADFSHLENGPAALFSSFAQGLLFSTDDVQKALSTSEDCIERYSAGQRSGVQQPLLTVNLQSREIDYEYGKVGHDMPFKGVGPLALAALSGMCNTHYLEDQQKLQLLVDSAVNSELPVPAWVFKVVVKNIDSVQI